MRAWRSLVIAFVVGSAPLSAQAITLAIKPRVGDTLRMRLDQESEITGVRKTAAGEMSAMVVTTMKMFSRAIVEGAHDGGTAVLAVTDSVRLSTTDDHSRAAAVLAESQMNGQRVRFRVMPDGTVGMLSARDGASTEVAQVVSLMPATFPKSAIKVGESWIREMPLPDGTQIGARLSGKLHCTFRLDSLTHGGEWAYVSMRGDMEPAKGPGAAANTVLESGMVNGTMLVDQKRGWLTESWFNIVVNSLQTFAPATGVLAMRVHTRITQHMHTFERRER
jgi:hypothetical protein